MRSVVMVKEALRPHAEYLVNAGLAVLAIDYRTVGSSEGEPRCQWFPERQVEDMRAGVAAALPLPEPVTRRSRARRQITSTSASSRRAF